MNGSLTGRLVESGERVRIEWENGVITRVIPVADAPERWLAPGLVDIQVNGYRGYDANASDATPETIVALVRSLWAVGVTAFCPTIITGLEAHIIQRLAVIAAARERDPLAAHCIPCVHVEGPYIAREDGPRGAHPAAHVRPPDLAEFDRWQAAAGGIVKVVTLAPEWPGAPEFIRALAARGVVVAIGHTAASGEAIRVAAEVGARLSTHLGNGAHATLPRHPNYLWEQLAEDRLWASFIFDGHHLAPPVMRAMLRAKGIARSILVSDSTAIAGLPFGTYRTPVGGDVELHADGRLTLTGTPYLAGSASTLADGIANTVRHTDATLAQAVAMASAHPARLLGLDAVGYGSLRPDAPADFVAFTLDANTGLVVRRTVVQGRVVSG